MRLDSTEGSRDKVNNNKNKGAHTNTHTHHFVLVKIIVIHCLNVLAERSSFQGGKSIFKVLDHLCLLIFPSQPLIQSAVCVKSVKTHVRIICNTLPVPPQPKVLIFSQRFTENSVYEAWVT